MAGQIRPAIIIAGIAGLCVSMATGVGLGAYTTTGINPMYSEAHGASAYADETAIRDIGFGERAATDQFSEATARHFTRDDFSDRPNDES